jgi:hypothetical protein
VPDYLLAEVFHLGTGENGMGRAEQEIGGDMPRETSFLEQTIGNTKIEVLKSYDKAFAREAFDQMDEDALEFLAKSLHLDSVETASDLSPKDPDYADSIWEEMADGAREDWDSFSYFIVAQDLAGETSQLFVSADWPSAEAFAKKRISLLQ